MDNIREKLHLLNKFFVDKGAVAVAFSGGVDSSFLLKIAHNALKDNVVAITVSSPAHAKHEINAAKKLAKAIGVKHIILASDKLESGVAKNSIDRCYVCKKSEFALILGRAKKMGINYVVEGTNTDDQFDYRPGVKAINELGVFSPLKTYGFTKSEIRKLSKKLGLPTWNKPSTPCLMSRFPYGNKITINKLRAIEKAEEYLMGFGISQVRVRHHDAIARIEVNKKDFSVVLQNSERIEKQLNKLGFRYITLDLKGYRTGSMNEVLWKKKIS